MTSQLNVDTIADKAGTGPVGLNKQHAAKVWFQFNCTGTPANRGSFNASTLTDNGTGNMTESFTNNMNDQNYATTGIAGGDSGSWADSVDHYYVANPALTSSIQLAISYNASLADGERVACSINGDLA